MAGIRLEGSAFVVPGLAEDFVLGAVFLPRPPPRHVRDRCGSTWRHGQPAYRLVGLIAAVPRRSRQRSCTTSPVLLFESLLRRLDVIALWNVELEQIWGEPFVPGDVVIENEVSVGPFDLDSDGQLRLWVHQDRVDRSRIRPEPIGSSAP